MSMHLGDSSSWQRWQPSEAEPWNLRRVVHLHRRAGFAASWPELQRDLHDGVDASIDRILTGTARIEGVPDDFERIAGLLADAAVASRDAMRLKAWWLYRMLFGGDALTERMTLMWHNHFATSNQKVQDLAAMRQQNEIFRRLNRASFAELLPAVVKDEAMLVWLDAQANRREHPNENLAREIMELFTLGVGNYSETDIKEAARALTGWSLKNGTFHDHEDYHDPGEKTILGQKGPWRGDDLVRLLLDQPATPRRIAGRICQMLMGEAGISGEALEELADGLRSQEYNVGWAVETVLRSRAFFAGDNIGNRVLGPCEFALGIIRALELNDPPPSTLILAEWLTSLGQDLFYPPNVFGWPGGRAWITSRSVVGRANFATALVEGTLRNPPLPFDIAPLMEKHGPATELHLAVEFLGKLLVGETLGSDWLERVLGDHREASLSDAAAIRTVLTALLSSPEMHVG